MLNNKKYNKNYFQNIDKLIGLEELNDKEAATVTGGLIGYNDLFASSMNRINSYIMPQYSLSYNTPAYTAGGSYFNHNFYGYRSNQDGGGLGMSAIVDRALGIGYSFDRFEPAISQLQGGQNILMAKHLAPSISWAVNPNKYCFVNC